MWPRMNCSVKSLEPTTTGPSCAKAAGRAAASAEAANGVAMAPLRTVRRFSISNPCPFRAGRLCRERFDRGPVLCDGWAHESLDATQHELSDENQQHDQDAASQKVGRVEQ